MRQGIQIIRGILRIALCADQACGERIPFFVSVSIICVNAAAAENIAGMTNKETGAHAPVSLCTNLLLAFLLTSLTLTGLARLGGLQGLVGLTSVLATNTA
jgi:hypothetical protein